MASRTFTVERIHCAACERAIGKALGRLDGVDDAKGDAATNQVRVVFDEARVTPGAIAERLTAAGYPVTGVSPPAPGRPAAGLRASTPPIPGASR